MHESSPAMLETVRPCAWQTVLCLKLRALAVQACSPVKRPGGYLYGVSKNMLLLPAAAAALQRPRRLTSSPADFELL